MSKYHNIWWFYLKSKEASHYRVKAGSCYVALWNSFVATQKKFSFPNDSNLNNINFLWQFRLFFLLLLLETLEKCIIWIIIHNFTLTLRLLQQTWKRGKLFPFHPPHNIIYGCIKFLLCFFAHDGKIVMKQKISRRRKENEKYKKSISFLFNAALFLRFRVHALLLEVPLFFAKTSVYGMSVNVMLEEEAFIKFNHLSTTWDWDF